MVLVQVQPEFRSELPVVAYECFNIHTLFAHCAACCEAGRMSSAAYIANVCVHPNARRQSVASQLIEYAQGMAILWGTAQPAMLFGTLLIVWPT